MLFEHGVAGALLEIATLVNYSGYPFWPGRRVDFWVFDVCHWPIAIWKFELSFDGNYSFRIKLLKILWSCTTFSHVEHDSYRITDLGDVKLPIAESELWLKNLIHWAFSTRNGKIFQFHSINYSLFRAAKFVWGFNQCYRAKFNANDSKNSNKV